MAPLTRGPLALGLLLVLAACPRTEAPRGLGRRLAEGPARALAPSADGAWLAFLHRCARPPAASLPPDLLSCDLSAVPAGGGEVRRVAEGVSSLPGSFAWSRDGRALAALADHDYASNRGTLVVWRPGAAPRRVAAGVGFYAFAPEGSRLAFTAAGVLHLLGPEDAEPRPVAGASGVATIEFAPRAPERGGILLAARRGGAEGAGLLVVREPGGASPLAPGVADYGFAPSGGWLAYTARAGSASDLWVAPSAGGKPVRIFRDASSFAFAQDGSSIAFLAGVAPGEAGSLYLARLAPGPQPARRLARRVGEFRWARRAARLAWLQDFDPRVRAGTLAAGGEDLAPVALGRHVTAYDLSPGGERVAFLAHETAGGYSVDLRLATLSAGPRAETVARGVFGFAFSPEGDRLCYRTSCVRSAEACDLYALPAAGLAGGRPPRPLAEGVKSFEFDRRNPGRLLVTWSRRDRLALDLGVLENGKLTAVDRAAVPGTAAFLPPDSRRLAYAVADPARAGVYVADLGR